MAAFRCIEEALEFVKAHEERTDSRFVTIRSAKKAGAAGSQKRKILFEDLRSCGPLPFDGTPFIIHSCTVLACQHGRDRHEAGKKKAKINQLNNESDHPNSKKGKRFNVQSTIKRNCEAKITIREIKRYPEFKIQIDTPKRRLGAAKRLKVALLAHDEVVCETSVVVQVNDCHSNHLMGEAAGVALPVDSRIKDFIIGLVTDGVRNIGEIKRHTEIYVKRTIFDNDNKTPRSRFNRRFFPLRRDFENIVYKTRVSLMASRVDQENVQNKISVWKKEHPTDTFIFRPYSDSGKASVDDDGDTHVFCGSDNGLLVILQSTWQRTLLAKYGELCLLDATYRTTRYALPVFFLCVRTNVDYIVVATFITQHEDSSSIAECLRIIKSLNPEWTPQQFMVDCSESEMKAIQTVFEGHCRIYLCDFHREQAWVRWTGMVKNGVTDDRDELLSLLRKIASATTVEEYEGNLKCLKESRIWLSNPNLQRWFSNTWLKQHERWVAAFKSDSVSMNINTNNGVERQNRALKHDYLAKYRNSTLSELLIVIVEKYLPDAYRKYVVMNVQYCDAYRTYSNDLPPFLHNRPRAFVLYVMKRLQNASGISESDITVVDSRTLKVFSSESSTSYQVFFGSDNSMPHCQCYDWKRSLWPCKHFCAAFMKCPEFNWEHLSTEYRCHPYFVIDRDVIESITKSSDGANANDVEMLYNDNNESDFDNSTSASTNDTSVAGTFRDCQPEHQLTSHELSSERLSHDCRDTLRSIIDMTYNFTDYVTLTELHKKATDLHNWFRRLQPNDEGLILLRDPVKQGSRKRKFFSKTNLVSQKKSRKVVNHLKDVDALVPSETSNAHTNHNFDPRLHESATTSAALCYASNPSCSAQNTMTSSTIVNTAPNATSQSTCSTSLVSSSAFSTSTTVDKQLLLSKPIQSTQKGTTSFTSVAKSVASNTTVHTAPNATSQSTFSTSLVSSSAFSTSTTVDKQLLLSKPIQSTQKGTTSFTSVAKSVASNTTVHTAPNATSQSTCSTSLVSSSAFSTSTTVDKQLLLSKPIQSTQKGTTSFTSVAKSVASNTTVHTAPNATSQSTFSTSLVSSSAFSTSTTVDKQLLLSKPIQSTQKGTTSFTSVAKSVASNTTVHTAPNATSQSTFSTSLVSSSAFSTSTTVDKQLLLSKPIQSTQKGTTSFTSVAKSVASNTTVHTAPNATSQSTFSTSLVSSSAFSTSTTVDKQLLLSKPIQSTQKGTTSFTSVAKSVASNTTVHTAPNATSQSTFSTSLVSSSAFSTSTTVDKQLLLSKPIQSTQKGTTSFTSVAKSVASNTTVHTAPNATSQSTFSTSLVSSSAFSTSTTVDKQLLLSKPIQSTQKGTTSFTSVAKSVASNTTVHTAPNATSQSTFSTSLVSSSAFSTSTTVDKQLLLSKPIQSTQKGTTSFTSVAKSVASNTTVHTAPNATSQSTFSTSLVSSSAFSTSTTVDKQLLLSKPIQSTQKGTTSFTSVAKSVASNTTVHTAPNATSQSTFSTSLVSSSAFSTSTTVDKQLLLSKPIQSTQKGTTSFTSGAKSCASNTSVHTAPYATSQSTFSTSLVSSSACSASTTVDKQLLLSNPIQSKHEANCSTLLTSVTTSSASNPSCRAEDTMTSLTTIQTAPDAILLATSSTSRVSSGRNRLTQKANPPPKKFSSRSSSAKSIYSSKVDDTLMPTTLSSANSSTFAAVVPDTVTPATEGLTAPRAIHIETSRNGASTSPYTPLNDFPYCKLPVKMLNKSNVKRFITSCGGKMSCGSYTLNEEDLMSILPDTYVTDNIIDAYLECLTLSARKRDVQILALPSQVMLQWETLSTSASSKCADWNYEKIYFSSFHFILIPLCTLSSGDRRALFNGPVQEGNSRGQHWMLLVADVQNQSVRICNSLQSYGNAKAVTHYLEMFRLFMEKRSSIVEHHLREWKVENVVSSGTQSDGSSCGIFLAMNADVTMTGTPYTAVHQKHVPQYRNIIFTRLCEMTASDGCAAMTCIERRKVVQWVLCDNCRLWHHFRCEMLKAKPSGIFYCAVCRSLLTTLRKANA